MVSGMDRTRLHRPALALVALATTLACGAYDREAEQRQRQRRAELDAAIAAARATLPPPPVDGDIAALEEKIAKIEGLRHQDMSRWTTRVLMLAEAQHVSALSLETSGRTIRLEVRADDPAQASALMRALQAAEFRDVNLAFNEVPERYAKHGELCRTGTCNRLSMEAPRDGAAPQ